MVMRTLIIFSHNAWWRLEICPFDFLFYKIYFGRMGEMRSEYKIVDRRVHNSLSEWIEVCSGEDTFCTDCVVLNIDTPL